MSREDIYCLSWEGGLGEFKVLFLVVGSSSGLKGTITCKEEGGFMPFCREPYISVADRKNPMISILSSKVGHGLNELPAGLMGKMLVYKSGAVKMKLGDTIYDVSPGSDCIFAQNVAAINVEEKHCIDLEDVDRRHVVTPDVDSVLNGGK